MSPRSEGRAGPLGPPGLEIGANGVDGGDCDCVVGGGPSGPALPVELSGGPCSPALPVRKKLPHGIPGWVKDGAIYFITICCASRGANQLCVPNVADTLFEAVKFRQERLHWHVHLMLLMPDHLHGLVSFGPDHPMTKTVANFKEMTAKRAGIHWQSDFFDHRLRGGESFAEKANYIRLNPVRKGLVPREEDWLFVWSAADAADAADANAAGPAVPPYLGNKTAGSASPRYL